MGIAFIIIVVVALLSVVAVATYAVINNGAIEGSANLPQLQQRNFNKLETINPVSPRQVQKKLPNLIKHETPSIQTKLQSNHSKAVTPVPKLVIGPAEPIVVEPTAINPIVISPNNPTIINPGTPVPIIPQLKVEPATQTVVAPQEPTVINPSITPVIVVEPTRAVTIEPSRTFTVEPPKRAAWEERGWTHHTDRGRDIYEGQYQVAQRRNQQLHRFEGRIEVHNRNVTAYIADPPPEIKRHPHGACFQLSRHPPWFRLHWARPARNIDDALLYMERVLDESIN